MSDRFVEIYHSREWGPGSRSGIGSDPERTGAYRQILSETLARPGVRTVVDLGCGDWAFSSMVDWSGLDYTGIDIVPELVDDLTARYGTENIRFLLGDGPVSHLPGADLLICKEVLQHWSNEAVLRFLPRLRRFKHALLTNDVEIHRRSPRSLWRYRPAIRTNSDIEEGGYRPLDLRAGPFGLEAECLGTIRAKHGPYLFIKEMLLWTNPEIV